MLPKLCPVTRTRATSQTCLENATSRGVFTQRMTWPLPYHYPVEFDCYRTTAGAAVALKTGILARRPHRSQLPREKRSILGGGGYRPGCKMSGAMGPLHGYCICITRSRKRGPRRRAPFSKIISLHIKSLPRKFPGARKVGPGILCLYRKVIAKNIKKIGNMVALF